MDIETLQSQIQSKESEVFAESPAIRQGELFQDSDIHVFARSRPVFDSEREQSHFRVFTSHGSKCLIHEPGRALNGDARLNSKEFLLDHTFACEAPNEEVFQSFGPMVPMVLGGGTWTVLAYGQTGTGKTYTMTALTDFIAHQMFAQAGDLELYATYVEVLGDQVKDLTTQEAVTVREDRFRFVQLQGSSEHRVHSAEEFLSLTERAVLHRRTEATLKNATSSRSHAVIKIRIHNADPAMRELNVQDGYLYLVDLAGSERAADRSAHSAERMKEAKLINTSLMTLKDCIKARSSTRSTDKHLHIPYRHSKLTMILRDSFELAVRRPVKLAVIACVSPLECDTSHSVNTLRYAHALMAAPRTEVLERNLNDPTYWTKDECLQWLARESDGAIEPTDMLPNVGDNGMTLVSIPEGDFIARATKAGRCVPATAQALHVRLWTMVADARTSVVRSQIYRKPQADPPSPRHAYLRRKLPKSGSSAAAPEPAPAPAPRPARRPIRQGVMQRE